MKTTLLILSFLICTTVNYAQQTGSFTDYRDGKVYKTVKIGTQTWMAENLAFKTESGCWAYDNDESNVAKYGRFYNWETSKKVCPAGWHLPSDKEWKTLTDFLGGENVAGGKMKSKTDWNDPNTGATNKSGFNALPAGFFDFSTGFPSGRGACILFWSSTPDGKKYAWRRNLNYELSDVIRIGGVRKNGFSVRCLKN
jgi:uncharacterized protein (TIGR02145 family)